MEQLSSIVIAILGAIAAIVLWANKSGKDTGRREAGQEAAREAAEVAEEVAVERAEETHGLDRDSKFRAVVERFLRGRPEATRK